VARKGPKADLSGTGLYIRTDSPFYWWAASDTVRQEMIRRSTKQTDLGSAVEKAKQFADELQARIDGQPAFPDRRSKLATYLAEFVEQLEVSGPRKERVRLDLDRAIQELELVCLNDLHRCAPIKRRMKKLREAGRYSDSTLKETFQHPLKRFSRWLYEEEIIERDGLDGWRNIKVKKGSSGRRAMLPAEFVRALYAADMLQALNPKRSPWSMRTVWTTLLVATPRITAAASLDVEDFDRERRRLLLGEGVGNKGRGAGYIDAKTCTDLDVYLDGRNSGPLLFSPSGKRLEKSNTLKDWRSCFSLAQVDLLWPDHVERDFKRGYLVHLSLMKGDTVFVLGGGRKPGPKKQREREERKKLVDDIVRTIEPQWADRMAGVDVHAFRMTARTWCVQQQLPEVFIDLQLGHASERNKAHLAAFWSLTGAKHYTDYDLLTGNAVRVAEAIRQLIDEADAEYLALPDAATFFRRQTPKREAKSGAGA